MNTGYYEYGVADYTMPRRANGQPHITKHRVRVEIIDAGPARTKVRFLEYHIDGRGPGTMTSVKSRNVKQNGINCAPVSCRLPYKDD